MKQKIAAVKKRRVGKFTTSLKLIDVKDYLKIT